MAARPPAPRGYDALRLEGKALGLGPAEFDEIEVVRSGGLKSLEIMRDAGLRMAFGSVTNQNAYNVEKLIHHYGLEFRFLVNPGSKGEYLTTQFLAYMLQSAP